MGETPRSMGKIVANTVRTGWDKIAPILAFSFRSVSDWGVSLPDRSLRSPVIYKFLVMLQEALGRDSYLFRLIHELCRGRREPLGYGVCGQGPIDTPP